MHSVQFYYCEHCENLVEMVHSSGVNLVCCGQDMTELTPNTTDAAGEKHLPVITQEGNKIHVEVGSTAHPMGADHYIAFICLETKQGCQRKELRIDAPPCADFMLTEGDQPVAVYAYCNLHSLWMTEL